MTNPDSARQTESLPPLPERAEHAWGNTDPQLQRIQRIGKSLFDVTNCVITFGAHLPDFSCSAERQAPGDAAFIATMPMSEAPVVITDVQNQPSLARQHLANGAPSVQFFASYPVYKPDRQLAANICLIDYVPRQLFGDIERQMLADLAGLVERELELRSVNALQVELQKKNKNLRRKSLIDPLIGTWNRGAIMRILTIEAIRCDKAGVPLSLIVADLDFFKKINDTYGHPAGDAVLVKVASRLRSCIRPQEALGRYGGEEFLIVLPGSSHTTAMAVAERMRLAIASQPEAIGSASLNLTISAGVASTDLFPNATTEELISRADVALYAAKDGGRNRVEKAIPDLS